MRESVPFGVRTSRLLAAIRQTFVPGAVAWAVALPMATFAASRAHQSAAGAAFVVAVYSIGSLVCHQLPARSFHLWAVQMPVCARCTGIYLGAVIGAVAARVAPLTRRPTYTTGRGAIVGDGRAMVGDAGDKVVVGHRFSGANWPLVSLIIAALPTLLTLVYEWTSGHTPANGIRAAAGLPIGVVVAWLVVAAADNRVN
jgi:Predicted membrane protein (DUF2085)